MLKNPPTMQETRVQSLGQEDLLEKEIATHSVFLPGKSHRQWSLVGYSPWNRKESDMMEPLSIAQFSRSSSLFLRVNFY